jgi:hypothetical protein
MAIFAAIVSDIKGKSRFFALKRNHLGKRPIYPLL